jgi:hypothetical protein
MNEPLLCTVGLDPPEYSELRGRIPVRVICHETLPRIMVSEGKLLVQRPNAFSYVAVDRLIFHGIFEDDHDFIAALALWGGPCLPSARAMMDCRLKLPCLVRAMGLSRFAAPRRGFAAAGTTFEATRPCVAKWGNWHCGENKEKFDAQFTARESTIIEPFIQGTAVRVVVIGRRHWQIALAGADWRKSIHDDRAHLMPPDPRLVEDTVQMAGALGLRIAANDYIVSPDGTPHLLELNHIPNVTRFAEIREAYLDYAAQWAVSGTADPA